MATTEWWQVELDASLPSGARVEWMPDGWVDDPENIAYFTLRVIVEDVTALGLPQMRITDVYRGNGEHWFVATAATKTEVGYDFDVEAGGILQLSGVLPADVLTYLEDIRSQDLPIFRDEIDWHEASA